ncbi:TPA: hypothetical protein IAB29_04240 [Candidatus Ventrenecus stercoripullorum]|nr:hypothetical protein [Candidatus Ventrenecus stercoripullorum]
MYNIENIKGEILEIFAEKQNYDEKYNSLMFDFITKAYELVELSEDLYQVEHTIKLNQISLKDYILNSKICNYLKDNNFNNYSIEDLKEYMQKYENQNPSDMISYKLALELYEKLEEIKDIEKSKIDYEISRMGNLLDNVSKIESVTKDKYQALYNDLLQQVKVKYLDNNLIDDKTNNYVMKILNDIFNYYLYGNKEIPL